MLDRTIPYYNVLMRNDGQTPAGEPALPKGFRFRGFCPGDELRWAEMETACGDFANAGEALSYFRGTYLLLPERLSEGFIGVCDGDGVLVGSVIGWQDSRKGKPVSALHWLIVDESVQGRGIGRALVQSVLKRFAEKKAYPVYLHTQPWSYTAVGLYSSLGFRLLKSDCFRNYENQTEQALPVLRNYMRPSAYRILTEEML